MLTLKTSQALWEAGVRINSEKWWCKDIIKTTGEERWQLVYAPVNKPPVGSDFYAEIYPAPPTDDLLRVLPEKKRGCRLTIHKLLSGYEVYYHNQYGCFDTQFSEELDEAVASMVLWLVEQGYHFDKEKQCLVKKEGV